MRKSKLVERRRRNPGYQAIGWELEGAVSAIGFYGHTLQNKPFRLTDHIPTVWAVRGDQTVVTSVHPRTMLGVKEDGTVIMGIVEGRQTGKPV